MSRSRRPRSSIRRRTIDFNLAPETPHIYTVRAVRINGGLPSQQSEPVGATTVAGMVVRVPQDYPTIQNAINASWSMTSIHVAPGTYTEPLNLSNKYGITIKGQDANGCVLDYSGGPSELQSTSGTRPASPATLCPASRSATARS